LGGLGTRESEGWRDRGGPRRPWTRTESDCRVGVESEFNLRVSPTDSDSCTTIRCDAHARAHLTPAMMPHSSLRSTGAARLRCADAHWQIQTVYVHKHVLIVKCTSARTCTPGVQAHANMHACTYSGRSSTVTDAQPAQSRRKCITVFPSLRPGPAMSPGANMLGSP
jgi:hypothetical protein